MLTFPPGTYPTDIIGAFSKLKTSEGYLSFYRGFRPICTRQIPHTVIKFVTFERTVEAFYKYIFKKPKNHYSKVTQLSVTFCSGYIGGVACAIISHPIDTIVSKLYGHNTVRKILSDIGFAGLWRGLSHRIIIMGSLTGAQWWIYDAFKSFVGLETTGGITEKVEL